jgi:hypothetical protein
MCDSCYAIVQPGAKPHRLVEPEDETCCRCRKHTRSGIYVRIDPLTLGGDR